MSTNLPAIDLARASYDEAMRQRDVLLDGQRRGQRVDQTQIWIYTQLAQEAAAVLASAWKREADRLMNLAIDGLPR